MSSQLQSRNPRTVNPKCDACQETRIIPDFDSGENVVECVSVEIHFGDDGLCDRFVGEAPSIEQVSKADQLEMMAEMGNLKVQQYVSDLVTAQKGV